MSTSVETVNNVDYVLFEQNGKSLKLTAAIVFKFNRVFETRNLAGIYPWSESIPFWSLAAVAVGGFVYHHTDGNKPFQGSNLVLDGALAMDPYPRMGISNQFGDVHFYKGVDYVSLNGIEITPDRLENLESLIQEVNKLKMLNY